MKRIEELPDGSISFVARIVPRASRTEISGWCSDGSLKIRIAAAPVDDAANRELVKFLAKVLGTRKSDILITAGEHSRTKRLSAPAACKNRLSSLGNI